MTSLRRHEPTEDDPPPKEACGVFGVFAPGQPVAQLVFVALQMLQHRGEESAGIAVGNGNAIDSHRDLGLVNQVFDPWRLQRLHGHVAIGHTRYSTSGPSTWANAQPALDPGTRFALAHNGNLVNMAELLARAEQPCEVVPHGGDGCRRAATTSDSHLIAELLTASLDRLRTEGPDADLVTAVRHVLPLLRGAFTLVLVDRGRLLATRDPYGLRPLTLGRLDGGWVLASETAAIQAVGAKVVREVAPAELLVIDEHGLRSVQWAPAQPRACLFEYVYLTRADSVLDGRSVYEARFEAGRLLVREAPAATADLVVGVPDTGTPAALGFAAEAGLPYAQGFVRSPYVGRTFIQPTQGLRSEGLRLKLAPVGAVVRGRRLVVVDDSIVRGNTQRLVAQSLRDAGADEVHLRIASPPIRWPCFYGFDFATRDQLIAADRTVGELCSLLGADSLAYLSLAGLVAASGRSRGQLCRACMDGCYPITQGVPVGQGTP